VPPFDPGEFLKLARVIADSAVGEAHLRTAAGRAYYAAHLHAREQLHAAGVLTPTFTGADHDLVIQKLRERGGIAGNIVDSLRALRIRADYRLNIPVRSSEVSRAVSFAEAIWDDL
jgi:uncharacterized protein (UPF0332 family)